jgi:hypothetical protein
MIGQSATGQGHEIFNLSEKELVYKQKVSKTEFIKGEGHNLYEQR